MKFIANWRDAWKFLSIQVNALCAAAAAIWTTLPGDQQTGLLAWVGFKPSAMVAAAFGASTLARLIAQPALYRDRD